MDRERSAVRDQQILGHVIGRDVAAQAQPSAAHMRQIPDEPKRARRDARNRMKVDESLGVKASETENVFGGELSAAVKGAARRGLCVPFEQKAVEGAWDLPVFAPRDRGGDRTRSQGAGEFDRRREPSDV